MSDATGVAVRDERQAAAVKRLDALAFLLDDWIPIAGTKMRFGLDAIVGLVPGVGDVAGVVLSGYIVLQAARLGAGFSVVARMILNLVIDAVVGSIPLLGDLFDAGFKANDRNLRLLHRAIDDRGGARRSSFAVLLAVALLLVALLGGTLWLIWWLFHLLAQPFSYSAT